MIETGRVNVIFCFKFCYVLSYIFFKDKIGQPARLFWKEIPVLAKLLLTRIQRVISIWTPQYFPSKHLLVLRRLEDVLKASCKTKNYYAENVLKMLRRQTKCFLEISVSNKSMSPRSISDASKANPNYINQNPIIQSSISVLLWNSSSIFIFRIRIPDDCSVFGEAVKTKF